MWKELLERALGGGAQPAALPSPDFAEDKPDYTPVIFALIAVAAVLAIAYFIIRK